MIRKSCQSCRSYNRTYTGLGIGWGDDAQKKFGTHRVECVTFSAKVKEALAYPVRGKMEDSKLRIPYKPEIRADLRAVTKETTAAGNIRFTAERSENGHADRFWALALAVNAASGTVTEYAYHPVRKRDFEPGDRHIRTTAGFGTMEGTW